jgi:hypothetical protein
MDLGTIGERLKTAPARAVEFFKGAAEKFGAFLDERAGPLADRLLSRIPREKQKPLFFCLGGIVTLLICVVVIKLAAGGGTEQREIREVAGLTIPPEELFFPGEPDFVPPLLLEREPRRFWTPDDIAPFWEDPEKLKQDQWLKEMERVIDTLMEDVP